ncbi:methylthioribose kinase [Vibrio harveyi]|uniref:S-methyl-5-thioribose kinase n=1 Tax=Vibrio harveyi TaxID=669 RepID=UPI000D78654E|nr:S-methyl-5-thioribose kinase [Vibrio harveyi]GBL00075.1 methylthioribose kinase [Vibrio harveyi]
MSQYLLMSKEKAAKIVKNHFNLNGDLIVEEISGGNMNVIFRVTNNKGFSTIVKHSPPYIRCIGEEWPLTQNRIITEYYSLDDFASINPKHVVKIYALNRDENVILMEYLEGYIPWREFLIHNKNENNFSTEIGKFMGDVYSRYFYLNLYQDERKKIISKYESQVMCDITSSVFFDYPYYDNENNMFDRNLINKVNDIYNDNNLKEKVAKLKCKFYNKKQSLLHGDLHTGSIMVKPFNNIKVIDSEFSFYGPIGFDIGSLFGNFLLNYCAHLSSSNFIAEKRLSYLSDTWNSFVSIFTKKLEDTLPNEILCEFINEIWTDSLGYAGTEMIRRTVGISHVDDIEFIASEDERITAQINSLIIGKYLILNANQLSINDLGYHIKSIATADNHNAFAKKSAI